MTRFDALVLTPVINTAPAVQPATQPADVAATTPAAAFKADTVSLATSATSPAATTTVAPTVAARTMAAQAAERAERSEQPRAWSPDVSTALNEQAISSLTSLMTGLRSNFVVAGIASLALNTLQLSRGQINVKQWLGLSALDTAGLAAVGVVANVTWAATTVAVASAFPGTALATLLVSGLASAAVAVGGCYLYGKLVRKPIAEALGVPR